ncbi:MAG: hypothetical protein IJS34_02795 [Alphaproteobacteria bacterium]|nr:hypothetical protein [Alphaproteobacteria bacterium]
MNRKKTIQTNKPNNKRLLLVLLVGFICGIGIMLLCLSGACTGCGGGWVALPKEYIEHFMPDIPWWFGLLSGFSFSALFAILWASLKNKYLKWILVAICALCYIGCVCYGYFVLPLKYCPHFVC